MHSIFLNLLITTDPNSVWNCLIYGLGHFLPLYAWVFGIGILAEWLFAAKRGHEIGEGYFVTSILFTLSSADDPILDGGSRRFVWCNCGERSFWRNWKNFLNPALTGRAFLYFAYPAQMSGDQVWVAVDGVSQATPLGNAAVGLDYGGLDVCLYWTDARVNRRDINASDSDCGGLVVCNSNRIRRVVAGVFAGMVLTASLFNLIGSDSNPMFDMPWYWHLVLGGFAFGMVFMATDPVSAAMTNNGRIYYGLLIGFMCVLIRVVNPAFPEGMMLAILFGNLFAPLFDDYVMQANIKRRLARG